MGVGVSRRVSAGAAVSGVVVLLATGCGNGSGVSLAEELETLPWLGESETVGIFMINAGDYERLHVVLDEELPDPEAEIDYEEVGHLVGVHENGLYGGVPTTMTQAVSLLLPLDAQREAMGLSLLEIEHFVDYQTGLQAASSVATNVDAEMITERTGVDPEGEHWDLSERSMEFQDDRLITVVPTSQELDTAPSIAEEFPGAVEVAERIDEYDWHAVTLVRSAEDDAQFSYEWMGMATEAEFDADGDYATDLVTLVYLSPSEQAAEENAQRVEELAASDRYAEHVEFLEADTDGDFTTVTLRRTSNPVILSQLLMPGLGESPSFIN